MSEKNINKGIVNFVDEEHGDSIIKVVGVGGGGGNAVNHMFKEGIHKVSFVLCNTDKQALDDSPVPVHLQLGKEGLGAGNRPLKAKAAAEESIDDIKEMFSDGTKMAFITAGMGGGTGTGAAPVIARVSKEMGILTVGIVTIPFRFEGLRKIDQALDGVEEMAKHVDALLVINNERLRQVYPELSLIEAFKRADDTLSVAAKSIAEIITYHGFMNLDFNDVKMVLEDGGVAIMSSGYGEGENRVQAAWLLGSRQAAWLLGSRQAAWLLGLWNGSCRCAICLLPSPQTPPPGTHKNARVFVGSATGEGLSV